MIKLLRRIFKREERLTLNEWIDRFESNGFGLYHNESVIEKYDELDRLKKNYESK